MLHVDGGERSEAEPTEEIKTLCETLRRSVTSCPFAALCRCSESLCSPSTGRGGRSSSWVPTPAPVLVYRNTELVGIYFWQKISKLHFRDETFELRVATKDGSETSYLFHALNRSDCKRLWRGCVEHHAFFRMSALNPLTFRLKHSSVSRSPAPPRLNVGLLRNKTINRTTRKHTNQRASLPERPMEIQTAPPVVQRRSRSLDGDRPNRII
ncbi:band 4.1-like protein 4 [Eleginops maclovinus]|uniref:band 4.1-like protein 4 n=1 Tax=Eleginops maclovinus TaxID=56733 RepID=UPI0030810305